MSSKMKRKLLIWVSLIVMSCALLTACGSKAEDTDETETVENTPNENTEVKEMNSESDGEKNTEDSVGSEEIDEEEDEEPIILSTEFDLQNSEEDENYKDVIFYLVDKDYTLTDGSVGYQVSFKIPQLKANTKEAAAINQDILDTYGTQMDEADGSWEYYKEELKRIKQEDESNMPVYEKQMDYRVDLWSDSYMGITFLGYDYGGGAHGFGFRFQNIYTIETGEKVKVSDLTSLDKDTYNQYFKDAFLDHIKKNPDEYWEDAAATIEETDYYEVSDCYLTKEGVTYYFYPYTLSYYAHGYVEVTLPYETLKMEID